MHLWTPFQERLVLHIVKNEDEKVVKDGAADLLRQQWAKVFEHTPVDEILGAQLLDECLKQFDCSEVVSPGKKEFTRFLSETIASAPSPDDLPYVAWKYCGEYGLETQTDLDLCMRRGNMLGMEFALEHRISPRG